MCIVDAIYFSVMVRYKNRYIALEVKQEKGDKALTTFNSSDLTKKVLATVNFLFGDFGAASIKNGFSASYCNEITKIAILRVRHGPHVFVTSALPAVTNIKNFPVKINTLYVGATLHHCYKEILRHQKNVLRQCLLTMRPDERSNFENEIINVEGYLSKNKRDI